MTAIAKEYKKHYVAFSQNIVYAARTWHHHVHLNNRAAEDPAILEALNKAPRYWLDQRYAAVQTTIIFLGKIFDNDARAHNVDKTLKAAHDEKDHFSKPELRKRKVESGGEFEGLDEYVENATEPGSEDFKAISAEAKKAKVIWERIKPLRDKIYAHHEILSDAERKALYEAVKNDDITEILQILLNISEALWQIENNGRKPDFSSNCTQSIEWAKKDVEDLIASLLHA
jgi:hypothetical protein